jgi:miniconductance mechanosensitive channel
MYMIEKLSTFLTNSLIKQSFAQNIAENLSDFIVLIIALIVVIGLDIILQKMGSYIFGRTTRKTKSHWDDILMKNKFFNRLVHLVPTFIFLSISDKLFVNAVQWNHILVGAVQIYLIILIILIINSFLKSVNDIYLTYDGSKNRPIKGYIQTIQIVIISFSVIVILSIFMGRSPLVILGGLGAFAAVLMLIFRDTILGFVAGIQISFNDMVRLGDWITMSKYGADGTVIDIALTTVKIQNWDKTISTIPAYSLISESFQNWRGMEESGGRRIKRSVNIDMNSIQFADQELLTKLSKIQLISDYIEQKEVELKNYNASKSVNDSIIVNGRRQTNIGIFRAYLERYLKAKEEIHTDMTFLIRHLQPTEKGIPIEIYVFSKIQEWDKYEAIQADIFDHILSAIPEFELAVYQSISGHDLRHLQSKPNA